MSVSKMMKVTSFKVALKGRIEKQVKGELHVYFTDYDSVKITVLDPHNKLWAYEEYGVSYKMDNIENNIGKDAILDFFARNFIQAYQQKIYCDYFKSC